MRRIPVFFWGLLGAGSTFIIFRWLGLPKFITDKKSFHLEIPPIKIPAIISGNDVKAIIDKISKPKISPTLQPLGWKLEWPSIPIALPFGNINITLPTQQLPLIPDFEMMIKLNSMKPTLTKEGAFWVVTFPIIEL